MSRNSIGMPSAGSRNGVLSPPATTRSRAISRMRLARRFSGSACLGVAVSRVGGVKHGGVLWFTMSTWNPYQAMLMTAVVTSDLI